MIAAKAKTVLILAAMLAAWSLPLAAHTRTAENSRLGLGAFVNTPQPAFAPVNQQNALGFPAELRQTRVRSRCTGKERDSETGLDYFGARYFSSAQGRFTSPDWSEKPQPVPYADLSDPQTLNLYSYVRNNPLRKADTDGHCGLIGGDTPCSLSQFVSSLPDRLVGGLKGESNVIFGTHFQPSNGEQAEVMGNVQEAAPVLTTGLAMVVPGPEKGEVVPGETVAPTFDAARTQAFEKAGMTNPENVTFSKVDPKTGTVVEFKGPNGAKVACDSPHDSPGPGHDQPHVGWQTGGKRGEGGTERGNIPYKGPEHPSRPKVKGEGDIGQQ